MLRFDVQLFLLLIVSHAAADSDSSNAKKGNTWLSRHNVPKIPVLLAGLVFIAWIIWYCKDMTIRRNAREAAIVPEHLQPTGTAA
jgi:hypothetical protein